MADKTAALPSDADFTTPSPIVTRFAVGPSGEHGYEIGYWQANADPGNPSHFVVVEGCYDQVEAAQRAQALNMAWMAGGGLPQAAPQHHEQAVAEDDNDEEPHKRGRPRR
jgi:hypothetical protein